MLGAIRHWRGMIKNIPRKSDLAFFYSRDYSVGIRTTTTWAAGSFSGYLTQAIAMKHYFLKGLSVTTVLAGLTWCVSYLSNESYSQLPQNASGHQLSSAVNTTMPAAVASTGTSMMASAVLSNGFQQIAIYDQPKQTMAVYHIDPNSGDIQLKSVRRLDADFALQEFNLSEPTPSTIRKNVR